MTKFLIDANTFLDFYRSNNDALQILDEVKKNKDNFIFSEQVFNEFMRNRVTELESLISNFKNSIKINIYSSSILNSMQPYIEIQDLKKTIAEKGKDLVKSIEEMIIDSEKDPVSLKIKELFQSPGVQVINVSDDDILRAKKRKLLGQPPTSRDKASIGDEVIWESLISKGESDIVIVSRDKTYSRNIDLLKTEYLNKTGKQLIQITDRITTAIRSIGNMPSTDVVELETKQLEEREKSIKQIVGEVQDVMIHFERYGMYEMACVNCGSGISQLQRQCHHCGKLNPFFMQDDDL
ncbi:PIN domain-containing protein [Paenibacillus sp. sgz500958]|uniref:PIN domain-containing protein n=1 Tax=Paenibacillus sp. sgz500958 TaxID=3242475 RepID=UPI0036D24A57